MISAPAAGGGRRGEEELGPVDKVDDEAHRLRAAGRAGGGGGGGGARLARRARGDVAGEGGDVLDTLVDADDGGEREGERRGAVPRDDGDGERELGGGGVAATVLAAAVRAAVIGSGDEEGGGAGGAGGDGESEGGGGAGAAEE